MNLPTLFLLGFCGVSIRCNATLTDLGITQWGSLPEYGAHIRFRKLGYRRIVKSEPLSGGQVLSIGTRGHLIPRLPYTHLCVSKIVSSSCTSGVHQDRIQFVLHLTASSCA